MNVQNINSSVVNIINITANLANVDGLAEFLTKLNVIQPVVAIPQANANQPDVDDKPANENQPVVEDKSANAKKTDVAEKSANANQQVVADKPVNENQPANAKKTDVTEKPANAKKPAYANKQASHSVTGEKIRSQWKAIFNDANPSQRSTLNSTTNHSDCNSFNKRESSSSKNDNSLSFPIQYDLNSDNRYIPILYENGEFVDLIENGLHHYQKPVAQYHKKSEGTYNYKNEFSSGTLLISVKEGEVEEAIEVDGIYFVKQEYEKRMQSAKN